MTTNERKDLERERAELGDKLEARGRITVRPRPLYRKQPADRVRVASAFLGRLVRVTINVHREVDGKRRVVEGELVAVAEPMFGTAADLVILRQPGRRDSAWSIANVESIEELRP